MEKAMIGMSQQKKAIIKQRLTSSVSIFLISPYFTTKTVPRAATPTTTIDQPMISHLKKSDKLRTSILNNQWSITNYQFKNLAIYHSLIIGHGLLPEVEFS
jgi:hypothetical protein